MTPISQRASCVQAATSTRLATWLAAAASATLLAVLPARAVAGTYTVNGCRNGWVADVRNTTALYAVGAYDNCARPNPGVGQLLASLGGAGQINAGDYAAWRFDAPPDTAIVATSLTWKGLGEEATADHGADGVALA